MNDLRIESGSDNVPIFVSQTSLNFDKRFLEGSTPQQMLGLHIDRATYPEYGDVLIHGEDLKMELSYGQISSSGIPKEAIERFLGHQPIWTVEKWKNLDSLTITNEKKQAGVNLLRYLPDNCRVFYMPDTVHSAEFYEGENFDIIKIRGDFTQLHVLVALIHEIGHAVSKKGQDTQQRQQLKKAYSNFRNYRIKMPPEEIDLVLNEERFAWDFALDILEPFFDPPAHSYFTKEGVLAQRDAALKSFDKVVAEKMGKPYELG